MGTCYDIEEPDLHSSRSAAKKEAAQRGVPNPYATIADLQAQVERLTAENTRLQEDVERLVDVERTREALGDER